LRLFVVERSIERCALSAAPCLAVLVLEDDDDIRETIASALANEGFHVYQAKNGPHALELLTRMPHPALILADLMLPVMSGWDFIKALSENDRLATLPVVVVSAIDHSAPQGFRRVKKALDVDEIVRIVSELCVRRT
jgi:CheY-like chemotaxis protein